MAQEWGSQPLDFNQKPRNVFINLLIWDLKVIQTQIFMEHKPTRAVRPLMGLINTLDGKSQKALASQYRALEKLYEDVSQITSHDVYQIFRQIMVYLHDTYLKEMQLARPKYKPGELYVPK